VVCVFVQETSRARVWSMLKMFVQGWQDSRQS
jgi:hypothetical protein